MGAAWNAADFDPVRPLVMMLLCPCGGVLSYVWVCQTVHCWPTSATCIEVCRSSVNSLRSPAILAESWSFPVCACFACCRDDIVFLIYLYQRWIYRVDMTRVNEFGFSGQQAEDATASQQQQPALEGPLQPEVRLQGR